jgi:signal transduction histidine kinase
VLVSVFAGLAIADRYVRVYAPTATRAALWSTVIVAILALLFGLVHQRSQALRIAERSVELEQLSAELYRANRAKSEFLANVSHELRTPLAAIVGFADLLKDGAYGELTPRQMGPVERIETSANHLQDLVEQILDLAKMAAGRLEVHTEQLKLRPFVIDVATEIEPLVTKKGLSFSIQVPASLPRIASDPTHLRQILVNLLGNAIKFTSEGSITLRATQVVDGQVARLSAPAQRRPRLAAGGSWVALQIIDTGTGVADDNLERIFEEFEQVNAGPRGDSAHRGTGLGLAISRRLARLLEGDLTVESRLGQGSTFTLWLPTDASDARERASAP